MALVLGNYKYSMGQAGNCLGVAVIGPDIYSCRNSVYITAVYFLFMIITE